MVKNWCIILLTFMMLVGIVGADDSTSRTAASMVSITDIDINPDVMMKGDVAIITVRITNHGDQNVGLTRASLIGTDSATGRGITVIANQNYDSIGDLGPGISREFTFTIKADGPDGVYYPIFYLDFTNAGSIRHSLPVKVQNSEITVTMLDIPDILTADKKETLTLLIGNPRENAVSGMTVTLSGDGITSTQSDYFIGILDAGESTKVSLDLKALYSTDLDIIVTYRNGMNSHISSLSLPIEVGESKTGPIMVVNNLQISSSGLSYTVSGDVNNAGITDAKSVVISVGSPARGIDPYSRYVVGSLESDDFSSFEVTFSGEGLTEVPIVVSYKDFDGNDYEMIYLMNINAIGQGESQNIQSISGQTGRDGGALGGMGMMGMNGQGLGALPLAEIAVLAVALILLGLAWKKGYLHQIRDAVLVRMKKE